MIIIIIIIIIEKEEKSQNTREAVRIKQRKNLCLGWESNPGPQYMRQHALTTELSRPSVDHVIQLCFSSHCRQRHRCLTLPQERAV